MSQKIYLLGGYQTDFAQHWSRAGHGLFDIMKATIEGMLCKTDCPAEAIQVAHVSNFVGELFCRQGHLGGMFAAVHPAFAGLPASRHEAACASGSIALLAACADIAAGHYDLACVVGVEQMRNVSGQEAADHLGAAAWVGQEAQEARYLWPWMFSRLAEVYDERYGLDYAHLAGIAKINFANARANPNAQTRRWSFSEQSFTQDDTENPVVEGWVRRQDCSQITDGGAALLLASEAYADTYAKQRGLSLDDLAYIAGWGHRTAPLLLESKLTHSKNQPYIFPFVRQTILDAFGRAKIGGIEQIHAIETHDCFTPTEYMAIDHFGITAPGESWKAIEDGRIARNGTIPINPSGGLMGVGHPVGASGIRMVLDAQRQVTAQAEDYQVEGARNVATLNIGGSATTSVCFVVTR